MISGMFHKIHELACMVEGTSEKIRYVLYDMYKGYMIMRRHVFHHGSIIVILSLQNERKNVKERRETHTHTHTQRATRSWKVQAFFFLSLKKTEHPFHMCECTYDSRRDHRRTRNHNEQFSLVEKCSLVFIYIYVSWLKKKKTEEIPKVSKTNMIAIEWRRGGGEKGRGCKLSMFDGTFFFTGKTIYPHTSMRFSKRFSGHSITTRAIRFPLSVQKCVF